MLPSSRAQVRARYLTPAWELPMAGHSTVGISFALDRLWRVSGRELRLELVIGVVTVTLERAEGDRLRRAWMDQGVPTLGARREDRGEVAAALGLQLEDLYPELPIQKASAGVAYLYLPLASLEALGRAARHRGFGAPDAR